MRAFRLLVTPAMSGADNMALDEALFTARLRAMAPPTIRFYAWAPPAISLGYGQAFQDSIDLDAARRMGVAVVRRPTGGSAVLHEGPHLELTYSVAAASGDFPDADELLATYRWIGVAIRQGLEQLGARVDIAAPRRARADEMATFCFAHTGSYELTVGGRKLVGSAQRRRGGGFLQHGSVLLGTEPGRLRRVFPAELDPLEGMTTLEAALGRRPSFDETAEALADGFRRAHRVELRSGSLSDEERSLAESLVRDKYGTEPWTRAARVLASPVSRTAFGTLPTDRTPSRRRGEDEPAARRG